MVLLNYRIEKVLIFKIIVKKMDMIEIVKQKKVVAEAPVGTDPSPGIPSE